MKTHIQVFLGATISALLLSLCVLLEARGALLLNEVLANPLLPESSAEFVEIWNPGPHSISLNGYLLGDAQDLDQLLDGGEGYELLPGRRALILDPAYTDEYDALIEPETLILFNGDAAFGQGGWSNSQIEVVRLVSPSGEVVDSMQTNPDLEPGTSLERIRDEANCPSCWKPSFQTGGTPGARNTRRHDPFALEILSRNEEGVELQALGADGFTGYLKWHIGLGENAAEETIDLNLEFEERVELSWPIPIITGHNPLRLLAWPLGYQNRLLLDTLLASDQAPLLFLDELRTSGEEFLEFLTSNEDPILLDALSLDLGSREILLAGTLWAGERILIGNLQSNCTSLIHIPVTLTLPQEGHVDLRYEGERISLGYWDMPTGVSHQQRLSPALPLEDLSSWDSLSNPSPGCPPHLPAQDREGVFTLSSKTFFPKRPGFHLLYIYAENAENIEVWSLDGRIHRQLALLNNSVVWDGRDSNGTLLPSGIYLLKSSTEILRSVALLW